MPFTIKVLAEIRDALLRDIKNLLPEADVGVDSDYWIRATSVASAVEGLYEYQAWQTRQIFPDTADSAYLRQHAALRRITPKPAVPAQGTVQLSGVVGSDANVGLQIAVGDKRYLTASAGTVGEDGTTTVNAVALINGASGNLQNDTPAQLLSAPAGISSQATILTMLGGLDEETDAQLLSRLLDRLRHPPAGGNVADYRAWALEIAGITDAFVFPHRGAVGRVDVAVISGNAPANADEIAAAQLNIDIKRPAACRGVTVFTPTLKPVDIVAAVKLSDVTDLSTLQVDLERDLAVYFDSLVPGATVIKSKVDAIIANSRGVTDCTVTAPAGNVSSTVDEIVVEWARLGSVTLSLLP